MPDSDSLPGEVWVKVLDGTRGPKAVTIETVDETVRISRTSSDGSVAGVILDDLSGVHPPRVAGVGTMSIGRANWLTLAGEYTSAVQFDLRIEPGGDVWLMDRSSNGTRLAPTQTLWQRMKSAAARAFTILVEKGSVRRTSVDLDPDTVEISTQQPLQSAEARMQIAYMLQEQSGGLIMGDDVLAMATVSRGRAQSGHGFSGPYLEERGDRSLKGNEDGLLAVETRFGKVLFAFDGLGGHLSGRAAVRAARQEGERLTNEWNASADPVDASAFMSLILKKLSAALRRKLPEQRVDGKDKSPDTTVSVVFVGNREPSGRRRFLSTSVGDSLAFIVSSRSRLIDQVTKDGSVRGLRVHGNGSVTITNDSEFAGSTIYHSLRGLPAKTGMSSSEPEEGCVYETTVTDGDVVALTTDGMTGDRETDLPAVGIGAMLQELQDPATDPMQAATRTMAHARKVDDRSLMLFFVGGRTRWNDVAMAKFPTASDVAVNARHFSRWAGAQLASMGSVVVQAKSAGRS